MKNIIIIIFILCAASAKAQLDFTYSTNLFYAIDYTTNLFQGTNGLPTTPRDSYHEMWCKINANFRVLDTRTKTNASAITNLQAHILAAGAGGTNDGGALTNLFSQPFAITASTTTTITNQAGRARWNLVLQLTDSATGTPAFTYFTPGIRTNTLVPLPGLVASVTTNLFILDVNPNTTNSITDASAGTGASVIVVDSYLTQPPN